MGLFGGSKSSSTTNQSDNRIDNGDGFVIGAHATVHNADSAQIAQINAGLLQGLGETQSDTVRFIAQMGVDTIKRIGESATDIAKLSAANSTQALGLAEQIANNYQPAENAQSDNMKTGLIVAGVVAAAVLLK